MKWRPISTKSTGDGLREGDDRRLPARLLQLFQTEFVADGKCDEAERNLRNRVQRLDLFNLGKSETGDAQTPQAVGADQNPRDQVPRDRRQPQHLDHAGKQKARHQRDGDAHQ